jgi:hypothetical protein
LREVFEILQNAATARRRAGKRRRRDHSGSHRGRR